MAENETTKTSKAKATGQQELAKKIAEQTDITQKKATEVLDATLDSIRDELQNGREVRLTGFGSFKVRRKQKIQSTSSEPYDVFSTRGISFSPSMTLSGSWSPVTSSPALVLPQEQHYIGQLADLPSKSTTLRISTREEMDLTAKDLLTLITALTELTTKYWLIAKERFADLIEYTQTHNERFVEESNTIVTRISHNSPFNIDWKVDLSAPSVAEALITTIEGIGQRQERLEKARLENKAKAQEIKEAEQKAEQEGKMALLEQEKQKLEIERSRLEILEKQLDLQKKSIEYALELAAKVIDTLHPGADAATRAMEIQTCLNNLIQLQGVRGLEVVLLPSPKDS
jgi:nucleoid DNA-binding protein